MYGDDPCREYLNSVRFLRIDEERLRLRLEELKSRCEKITATLSGMPRGGGEGQEALWALLADERDKYITRTAETQMQIDEVENFIDRVPAPEVQRHILKLRYLSLLNWRAVQKTMRAAGSWYEMDTIYKFHGRALNAARELWRKEHENDQT